MALKLQGTNSAAAPGLTNDGNDGVAVGTDSIDLSIAGASKFKVGSAGQLGIGGANYGTSGQVLKSGGASAAPTWGTITSPQGLTEADTWRVNAHTTSSGGGLILTANWERSDTDGFGKLGTGMTESSGVFTFPSTGIWEISFYGYCNDTSSSHTTGGHISPTVDNGSNYTTATSSYFSVPNVSTYSYGSFYNTCLFDVTDTSTHKTRFYVYSSGDVTWEGASDANAICAVFKKLGDT